MYRLIAVAVIALSAVAFAEDKKPADAKAKPEAPPPPPPEVKKTTEAFLGAWAGDATLEMGGKTEKFKVKADCKKIALGNGSHCEMSGKSSMGPMEQSCMTGYDPETKSVHFMCITSMGEVHDHKCAWSDDKTVTCEQYKGTMGGKAMTEDLTFAWADPKTMTSSSVVTSDDGKMSFSGTMKKK